MKNRIKIRRLMMIAAVGGALLCFFATRSNEPTHGGRSLSYWVRKLYYSDDTGRLQAQGAILEMGTNAVRPLIRMLPERDAAWKIAYNSIVLELFNFDWSRAQVFLLGGRSGLAARALGVIGPDANEAVPFLIQNMTNFPLSASSPSEYDLALSAIGADSVLPLTHALSHPDPDLRTHAASALGHMDYTNLTLAVPELIKLVNSSDVETRDVVTRLLGYLPGDALAQSALIGRLSRTYAVGA